MISRKILVLCEEDLMNGLLREVYNEHYLKFVSDHESISSIDSVKMKSFCDECDIMFITNLGIPVSFTKKFVSFLPGRKERTFRPEVLSGWIDEELISLCREKEVDLHRLPIPIAKLQSMIT